MAQRRRKYGKGIKEGGLETTLVLLLLLLSKQRLNGNKCSAGRTCSRRLKGAHQ